MDLGRGTTTASKPFLTKAHLCFSATDWPQAMPAPRLNQAALSLCQKLLNHQAPRPIRSTASQCSPLSQVVEVCTVDSMATYEPDGSD